MNATGYPGGGTVWPMLSDLDVERAISLYHARCAGRVPWPRYEIPQSAQKEPRDP